jgi:hypothetical protein
LDGIPVSVGDLWIKLPIHLSITQFAELAFYRSIQCETIDTAAGACTIQGGTNSMTETEMAKNV